MSKPTKTELSAINARLEELLAEKESQRDINEKALIKTQQEFDAYRKRFSPVPKQMIIRWFSAAVTGTTEGVLLRAYMTVLLDIMQRYGQGEE